MYCTKCGTELPQGAQACPGCGAGVIPAQGQPGQQPESPAQWQQPERAPQWQPPTGQAGQQPSEPYWPQPAGQQPAPEAVGAAPKKDRRPKVILLVALGIFALSAVLAVANMGGAFGGNPKAQLRRAADHSLATLLAHHRQAEEDIGIAQLVDYYYDSPTQLDYELLGEMPDGAGLMAMAGTAYADLPNKQLEFEMDLGLGAASMLSAQLAVEGELMTFSAPELFSGSLGVNAATFGQDYAASSLSGMLGALPADLSIDPFAPLESLRPPLPEALPGEDTSAELARLYADLWEHISVERTATEEKRRVNDQELSCTAYSLAIPAEALTEFLSGAANAIADDPAFDSGLLQTLEQAGFFSRQELRALPGQLAGQLTEEVTAAAWVHEGALVALELPGSGERLARLDIGGETHLSDALTLELLEGGTVTGTIEFWGNLVPESGAYSYSLFAAAPAGGMAGLDIYYDPSETTDNFALDFAGDSLELNLMGTLLVDKAAHTLSMDLYDIVITDLGGTHSYSVLLQAAPAENHSFALPQHRMLFEMNDMELVFLFMEMMGNSELLSEMMGGALAW